MASGALVVRIGIGEVVSGALGVRIGLGMLPLMVSIVDRRPGSRVGTEGNISLPATVTIVDCRLGLRKGTDGNTGRRTPFSTSA